MDVRTNRTVRERMTEWQLHQARVWQDLDNMALVLGEFAALGIYDEEAVTENV